MVFSRHCGSNFGIEMLLDLVPRVTLHGIVKLRETTFYQSNNGTKRGCSSSCNPKLEFTATSNSCCDIVFGILMFRVILMLFVVTLPSFGTTGP